MYGALDIPVLGSVIGRNSFTEPVRGLDTFPPEDLPPVNITHWAFQTMIGIGTLLALSIVIFWVARERGHDLLDHTWFLRFAAATGPLAVIALEAGWVATEVGRQPWVVYGFLRTPDAAGDNPHLSWLLLTTAIVYTAMTVGVTITLRSMARRWRQGEVDLPSPYGPQARFRDRTPDGAP